MSTEFQQRRFIESELLAWSIAGAFARARIYADGIAQGARFLVRTTLKQELLALAPLYSTPVNAAQHLVNIVRLAAVMTATHKNDLRDGTMRIGPAQKALNLNLKYLWCLGRIAMPPHCPVDAVVLAAAGVKDVAWTQIESTVEYERCMEEIKRAAGMQSIAEWECAIWTKSHSSPGRPYAPLRKLTSAHATQFRGTS